MREHWIELAETPRYAVSNLGNVYDRHRECLLAQTYNRAGYCQVKIQTPVGRMTVSVHRLVAGAFFDISVYMFSRLEVNHIDGNKQNNCIWNLELVTRSENMKHAYANKLSRVPNMKKVRCVETGIVFDTLREAARSIGVSDHKSIMRVLDRPQYQARGYHFVTVEEA